MKLLKLLPLFILVISTAKANEETIVQEVKYYSPNVAEAYLVWGINNWQLPDTTLVDTKTYIMDGLMYTRMTLDGDTLKATLSLPVNTTLNFTFWLTQSREGDYFEFWDTNFGNDYQGVVIQNKPIVIVQQLEKSVSQDKKGLLIHGWILMIVMLVILLTLSIIIRNRQLTISYQQKIVSLGLSLLLFHYLIRVEVVEVDFLWILKYKDSLIYTLRALKYDLLYLGILSVFFVGLMYILEKAKWKKLLYILYVFIGLFSLLAALINIKTIAYLSKPFTYEWLYYSDFFSSEDAKQTIMTEGSLLLVFNIIALSIAALALAKILLLAYTYLMNSWFKKFGQVAIGITFLVGGILFFLPTSAKVDLGKKENPVVAFMVSYFSANTAGHFFTMPLLNDTFSPTLGNPIKNILPEDRVIENVVVIVLESAGAEYFDLYGGNYGLTPDLSHFSEHALWFENAYAHTPSTNKSLVSLLCSIYPQVSYKVLTQEYPDIELPSISSIFKTHGFRTSFFASSDLSYQKADQFLSKRGFDTIEDFSTITCDQQFKLINDEYKYGDGIDDMCLADRFISWIDEDKENSFFSILWTVQGHYPYFINGEEKDFKVNMPMFNRYLNALQRDLDMVNHIMDQLKIRGLDSLTLIVLTGDHGEAFGRHSQSGHASNIYEENLRIPLLFINSQLFSGQKSQQLAGIKDVSTTICAIMNLPIPDTWQGRDLLSSENDEMYFFALWSGHRFGYRKGEMKYIFDEQLGTSEIYNLTNDPHEERNISAEYADSIPRAREAIGSWVQYQKRYIESVTKGKN